MMDNKKQKEEKKSEERWFYGLFNSQSHAEPNVPYCTPDQCFMHNSPQTFSSTNLITSQVFPHTEFNNTISEAINSLKLSELFSPELIQLITDAARQGFLLSVLITLTNEGVTDYLQSFHYHPDSIYWINQAVRALLLIALGTSPIQAIATPVAGYILNKHLGLSKEISNHITTGVTLGINLLTTPMSFIGTSMSIGTAIGTSLLGSKITKSGYDFFRTTFFENKKVAPIQNEDSQNMLQLS
ncbi:hypothetical protein [Legionella longbeachae]|uniref:Uncharacterized protein n=1 Tax=Legionella longbeachae serogroup 1 (strain NSW150) TaxID=661367 RepID=D3HR33_LEGLN|nr:hypothetical protein [Legionella longbeachae]HBD7396878.1 hypothetical protein [Legionella pneumophila]ARB91812.1 hypothetical protein A6J40_06270 [Legionella longbeachae]ARM35042.1 hypothetical protein B0B39_16680 [Legionella longbeachae]EEZ95535.1 conserved hypothetical protein [Legionella longbeachae D-4968]QIN31770.1 hypothetical protein GCB94_06230 [Legionella longbeachae]